MPTFSKPETVIIPIEENLDENVKAGEVLSAYSAIASHTIGVIKESTDVEIKKVDAIPRTLNTLSTNSGAEKSGQYSIIDMPCPRCHKGYVVNFQAVNKLQAKYTALRIKKEGLCPNCEAIISARDTTVSDIISAKLAGMIPESFVNFEKKAEILRKNQESAWSKVMKEVNSAPAKPLFDLGIDGSIEDLGADTCGFFLKYPQRLCLYNVVKQQIIHLI